MQLRHAAILKRIKDASRSTDDDIEGEDAELDDRSFITSWQDFPDTSSAPLLTIESPNTPLDPPHPDAVERLQHVIEIRPTIEPPPTARRPIQTIALLWLFTMANVSSNARNPLLPQPWRSMLDAAVVNPNRELGVALSYLFTSDIHDIAERLRLEGRGHAGLGILTNIAKILVGNLPVMAYGLGQGALLAYFEKEIEENAALKVLASPYVSRIITAILSTLIYTGARKIISRCYPVPYFKFNQTPPLHWLQRIAGFGFRIYDATTSWEFYRISISYFTRSPLHHPHFPLGATVVDQVNVNIVQRLALNYHPYNDTYPFTRQEVPMQLMDAEQVAQQDNEPLLELEIMQDATHDRKPLSPSLRAYEDSRSHVYSTTFTPAKCDNIKVVLWYSGRVAIVLAVGYTANLIGSQLVSDKEDMNDQLRMTYYALICLASAGAERIYENVLPWAFKKAAAAASSCWSSFYACTRRSAVQVLEDEDELDEDADLTTPTPL